MLRSGDLNPRRSWCFSGERMMLVARRLAQSCVRGLHPTNLCYKLMSKYRHGIYHMLSDASDWVSSVQLEEWLRDGDAIENGVLVEV